MLCAYGDATTQIQDEAARTYLMQAADLTDADLANDLKELRDRAGDSLLADGIALDDQEVVYQADLRYAGQAFQITVDFSQDQLADKGVALLTEAFDAEHEQLFTFKLEDGHEILMIRAVVRAKAKKLAAAKVGDAGATLADCVIQDTRFYFEGAWHEGKLYDRNKLISGLVVEGPAIVSEMDSTTVVLPGYGATVDKVGNLLINPNSNSH